MGNPTIELLESLLIIAQDRQQAIPKAHIDQLLADGYITPKYPTGWLANGKGRELLRRNKIRIVEQRFGRYTVLSRAHLTVK